MVIFTSAQCHIVDTAYHASLSFITNCKALTHHCELYYWIRLPALATHRLLRWYNFIYMAMLEFFPYYGCVFFT